MAKYLYTSGPRKGIVGREKYYFRGSGNFIQEASKYVPVHSQWLSKKEFKEYILSLLDQAIPQIYVLEELPEDLFQYALIFIQNGDDTEVYLDKEGVRTQIHLSGGEESDAVDITNNIPSNPRNNTIYFVNSAAKKEEKLDNKELKTVTLECDIYVYENDTLKKVNVDFSQVLVQANTYTDTKCSELEATCKAYTDTTCGTTLTTAKSYTDTTCATTLTSANTYTDTTCGTTLTSAKNYTDGKVAAFPHLYLHRITFDRTGTGEVNFVFYNNSSANMTVSDICTYLLDLNCQYAWQCYPACGAGPDGQSVIGIFAGFESSGGMIVRAFYIRCPNAVYWYTEYSNGPIESIKKIF